MENTETTKKVYFTKGGCNYMSTRLQPRSLISSTVNPGPPWKVFEPETDGVAYFAFDADERRELLAKG